MTCMHFQTPAQSLESPSPLEIGGGLGTSSWGVRLLTDNKILAGPKPLLLNVWSDPSPTVRSESGTSWYMGITGELLKVGGMGGVATEQSMKFSKDFMNLPIAAQSNPPSRQFMSRVNSILPMDPCEGYIPLASFLLPPVQIPTELDYFIIDSQSLFTPIKLQVHRDKCHAKAVKE